jgi:multiple sugar transport system permease protein
MSNPQKPLKPVLSAAWVHLTLAAVATLLVLPFVWMVLTSLKTPNEVGVGSWIPSRVLTDDVNVLGATVPLPQNYLDVFKTIDPNNPPAPEMINRMGIPYARYYWNSIFIASWVTFLQVLTSSLAAFSFARLKWPGRDKLFFLYLSTMMLPGLVMMIPNYQIMIQLNWVDSFIGLIVPGAFSAFGVFLLRQFMLTIPSSIDEAAEIDGASKWQLFWDIILPLARPGLIALTIFTFLGNYQSLIWPLIMLKSQPKYTLPMGLLFFDSTRGSQTHLLMAASTMAIIPLVVIFVLLQKYLVKGIQLGAVKG